VTLRVRVIKVPLTVTVTVSGEQVSMKTIPPNYETDTVHPNLVAYFCHPPARRSALIFSASGAGGG
jgi:hypothetical protein